MWRSIQDHINGRRGVQHGEKGGKHHRQKTKLFHINVICGLKTESFAALGASGQICLLCNAPSSLTKMVSLKHKSFSERRGIKGQPAQSDSQMARRYMQHSPSYLQIFLQCIYRKTNTHTHRYTQVDVIFQIQFKGDTNLTHHHASIPQNTRHTHKDIHKHMHMQGNHTCPRA